jgi:hypothetical protein
LQKRGPGGNAVGQKIAAQVLNDLQGKGQVGKETYLLTTFLVTFVAQK